MATCPKCNAQLVPCATCFHDRCPACPTPPLDLQNEQWHTHPAAATAEEIAEALVPHLKVFKIEQRTVIIFEVPKGIELREGELLGRNLQSALRLEHPEWAGLILVVPDGTAAVKTLGWLSELSDDAMRSVIEVLGRKIRDLERPGHLFTNLTR